MASTNEPMSYNYTYLPPLAMSDKAPSLLELDREWLMKGLLIGIKLFLNGIAIVLKEPIEDFLNRVERIENAYAKGDYVTAALLLTRLIKDIVHTYNATLNVVSEKFQSLENALVEIEEELQTDPVKALVSITELLAKIKATLESFKEMIAAKLPHGRPESIQDYNDMFKVIPLPKVAGIFETDAFFSQMRVAGFNPTVLEAMSAPMSNFPITNAQYQRVMGTDDHLEHAMKEQRLYVANYAILADVIPGSFPKNQKYLGAPIALFALPKGKAPERRLKAVAIQCGQDPSQYEMVQPPIKGNQEEANAWALAKAVVQSADGNHHEAVSHLGRTHLVVEPFILATNNQLNPDHPISKLLTPHFVGTLFINNAAQGNLVASGGTVDKIMGGIIDYSRVYAVKGTQSYLMNFNDSFWPDTLAQRGVADPETLPYYPYRDNGLMVWDAILQWVTDYVNIFYANDAAVVNDSDLQDWLNELLSHDGGRLRNIGEDGKLQTRTYLAKCLTMVIFTGSAAHAAVNFPQRTIMAYTPAVPLATYGPAPEQATDYRELLNIMPPLEQAFEHLNTGTLLGGIYYTQLGYYPEGQFDNASVNEALKKYQTHLTEIEDKMKAADPDGTYPFLYPSQIPQSINI